MAEATRELLTRAGAKAQGAQKYFTGRPCTHGHIAPRLVSTANCVECMTIRNRLPATKLAIKACGSTPAAKEAARLRSAAYHTANRDAALAKMRVRNQRYYERNRDAIIAAAAAYQDANRSERNAYKSAWQAEKKRTDPQFAAVVTMRKLVARTCDRIKAGRTQKPRTAAILGYSAAEFRDHIAKQFTKGMTWENHGAWHVDHIMPLAKFNLLDVAERRAANALSNLRPLWALDNLRKSDAVHTLL